VKILVKLGGTLLDSEDSRAALAAQLAAAAQAGARLVVVHGGGKQMTRFLEERGVASTFVRGLRVTTPEVVDALLKVFAGSVNKQLVASLQAAGMEAVGISGIDAGLALAEQLDPGLGAVGRVTKLNPRLLEVLAGQGFCPVVACVAGGAGGAVFNVNADQMAVAVATGYRAGALFFLTDVDGVRGPAGAILPHLDAASALRLIESGVATGGMQAKLESAIAALRAGVGEVRIAPGAAPGILGRLLAGEEAGTRLTLGEFPA
jgi:acetylglutamate kinase